MEARPPFGGLVPIRHFAMSADRLCRSPVSGERTTATTLLVVWTEHHRAGRIGQRAHDVERGAAWATHASRSSLTYLDQSGRPTHLKKGPPSGGPEFLPAFAGNLAKGRVQRLPPVNMRGLMGLASGLTISSVAPARSVCCRVLSPMCSFSPTSTRWSRTFKSKDSPSKKAVSYFVADPWYLANTENGAVGNRH